MTRINVKEIFFKMNFYINFIDLFVIVIIMLLCADLSNIINTFIIFQFIIYLFLINITEFIIFISFSQILFIIKFITKTIEHIILAFFTFLINAFITSKLTATSLKYFLQPNCFI